MANKWIFTVVLLAACASKPVPVTQAFPEAPEKLLAPAPALTTIPPDTREVSVIIDNATDNYTAYRELRILYEEWQQWYREQRENWVR